MKILTNFFGDPNVGLYGRASDSFVILGKFLEKKMKDFFGVKTLFTTISSIDLVGIFVSLNSNGIILPKIITEKELREVKENFDGNILVLKSRYTAVGNLILANDKGCVSSTLISKKEKKDIENVLGVECEYSTIAGTNIPGSSAFVNNKGCLAHRDIREDEIETIESILKVPVDIGTINMGSPFISSGIIANSKDAIIGDSTSGPEMDRIIRTLKI